MRGALEAARTAQVDGATLAYLEQGAGDPVVFVHGTACDLRTWEHQLPTIGRSFRAVAYSRRFAWPNTDIDPGVDDQMLPHVEDLVAFLRAIGATPAHLVGNSWGAFISLLTAVRHPDVVRSLVLEEPPVLPIFGLSTPPRPTELLRLLARRPRTALAVVRFGAGTIASAEKAFRGNDDETAMHVFLRGVLGTTFFDRLPAGRMQHFRDNLGAARAQTLGAGFPPLSEDQVRRVSHPTLLLAGEHTPAVFLRLTDRLEALLPNARRLQISQASHLLHEDDPAAANEAILAFLERHRAA